VFNTTFSNISAISWRPVLVVDEAGVPVENHQPKAMQMDVVFKKKMFIHLYESFSAK
jgi:hypothetical protein